MPLSKNTISRMLDELLLKHEETLPKSSQQMLEAFMQSDKSELEIIGSNSVRCSSQIIQQAHPGITPASLRKRVQYVNTYFASHGKDISLKQDNGFVLSFSESFLKENTEKEVIIIAQRKSKFTHDSKLMSPEYVPAPNVFLSHKWHDSVLDDYFMEIAAMLKDYLAFPTENKPSVDCIYDSSPDSGFEMHEVRQPQQDKVCEKSGVAIIFWSRKYFHSSDCKREFNYFIDEDGADQPGKNSIIVLELGRFKEMDENLKKRNIFMYPADSKLALFEFWEKASQIEKCNCIAALAEKVYRALRSQTLDNEDIIISGNNLKIKKSEEFHSVLLDASKIASSSFGVNKYRAAPIFIEQGKREKLIPALQQWANDFTTQSQRVGVLLGDFGFGKTVSCQMLAAELCHLYETEGGSALLPIYLDLKALQANIANHKDKPIEHLLESLLIETGYKLNIGGEEIITYIRENPCLVIFDGFDELGHHLSEIEQQSVYVNLLNIIPEEVYRKDAQRLQDVYADDEQLEGTVGTTQLASVASVFPSKLLISCRTHFFNKLSREESFLGGSSRHALGDRGTGLKNVKRYIVAPFSKETVKRYLCQLLGEIEGEKALTMLEQVHDLSELSTHPLMLSLITDQLPRLQALAAEKRTVNSATLYLHLFEAIGHRDDGKHIMRLSEKQELLAALALDMWRNSRTEISIKQLDRWFVYFANNHPVIGNQMQTSTDAVYKLMQDLCNACLLIRNSDDKYRFAHTSYFEFFLALGIFENIRETSTNSFNGLLNGADMRINLETLQFLVNWRKITESEERREFDKKFVRFLNAAGNDKPTKQLGFDIWHFGQLHSRNITIGKSEFPNDFPHSNNANWSSLYFENNFVDSAIKCLDLSHVDLSNCYFHLVLFDSLDLKFACFENAIFRRVYFHKCDLTHSNWENSYIQSEAFYPKSPGDLKSSLNPENGNVSKIRLNKGHNDWISSTAFNNDGSKVVSASFDSTLKLWDGETGECIRTFTGHTQLVRTAIFSEDGSQLVSASLDRTSKLWDSRTGECIRTFKGHAGLVNTAAFNNDGSQVVSASFDKTLKLWDGRTGECICTFKGHIESVNSAALNSEGNQIVSASSDNTVKLWDSLIGKCIRTLRGHTGPVNSASFNHDCSRIVSASHDNTLKLWDSKTGECLNTLVGHAGPVESAAFGHDGIQVVSASQDGTVKLWNSRSGECLQTLKSNRWFVSGAPYNQRGSLAISYYFGKKSKLVDSSIGKYIYMLGIHESWYLRAAFSHDGKLVVSTSCDFTIKLLDSHTGECVRILEGHKGFVQGLALNHDSSRILSFSEDNTAKVWDSESGVCLRSLECEDSILRSADFNYDGSLVVSAFSDNTIKLWDSNTGECFHKLEGHSSSVLKAAFNRDGSRIVSVSEDLMISLWDSNTGECIRTIRGHDGPLRSVAFNQDISQIVSICNDNILKLWDSCTGKLLKTLKGHDDLMQITAFNQDGGQLASAASDGTIKLWDIRTGECLQTFKGHDLSVQSVRFNHDGSRVVSASSDNTLKLWNVTTGQEELTVSNMAKGELVYRTIEQDLIEPKIIKGRAWQYLFAKNEDGSVTHPCQCVGWGSIYKPV